MTRLHWPPLAPRALASLALAAHGFPGPELRDGVVFRPDPSQARGAPGEVFHPLVTPPDSNEARR